MGIFENNNWIFQNSHGKLHGELHMIVLRKSEDEGYLEFINVMYKIDGEIIPKCRNELIEKSRLMNFIQMKAMQRLYKERLIRFINVVSDVH